MNPTIAIAERSPTESREQNDVRCAALCIQNCGPHGGFSRASRIGTARLNTGTCNALPISTVLSADLPSPSAVAT
jgi:hypothetical protein